MTATTTPEVEHVSGLLEKASAGADEAAMALTDVAQLCTNPNGEQLSVHDSRALLGHAYVTRTSVQWALTASEKALAELEQQVFLAEQSATDDGR